MCDKQKEEIHIGIIGAGGMGRFYAMTFAKVGWKKYVTSLFAFYIDRVC